MVLPALDSVIHGINDTLQALSIDNETIDRIHKNLTEYQNQVTDGRKLGDISEPAFGTLPAGREMGTHTTAAQAFLLQSLAEMLTALGLLNDGVAEFRHGVTQIDEDSDVTLQRIQQVVNQTTRINRHQRHEGGHR